VHEGESETVAVSAAERRTEDPTAPLAARWPVRAALALLWLLLLIAVALRRPESADETRLPDRPVPPVTVDLNSDPWPRLLLIDGIGESLARRIVRAREERGGFADLAEVQALPGVPDDAIERARPWLSLGPRGATRPSSDAVLEPAGEAGRGDPE
jgi:hypothetical protein